MAHNSTLALLEIIELFNAAFPVGTPCILRRGSGAVETRVRGPAELLSGHSAVAWFDLVTGAYSTEDSRVFPLPPSRPAAFLCPTHGATDFENPCSCLAQFLGPLPALSAESVTGEGGA